jgi:hypothetical protein
MEKTILLNGIKAKEFLDLILDGDREITSEGRLQEMFGDFYKHCTNNIWSASSKYPGTRSANDGRFKIILDNNIEIYMLQECKLHTRDLNKALCQICVYYNMETKEMQEKIKYFILITPSTFDIISVESLRPALIKIAKLMNDVSITPCKAYENPIVYSAVVFESEPDAIHFDWRKLDDMGVIIETLIDKATKDAIKEIENGNNNRRIA